MSIPDPNNYGFFKLPIMNPQMPENAEVMKKKLEKDNASRLQEAIQRGLSDGRTGNKRRR